MFANTCCESAADKPADAKVYKPSDAVPSDTPYLVPNLTISSDSPNKVSFVAWKIDCAFINSFSNSKKVLTNSCNLKVTDIIAIPLAIIPLIKAPLS